MGVENSTTWVPNCVQPHCVAPPMTRKAHLSNLNHPALTHLTTRHMTHLVILFPPPQTIGIHQTPQDTDCHSVVTVLCLNQLQRDKRKVPNPQATDCHSVRTGPRGNMPLAPPNLRLSAGFGS